VREEAIRRGSCLRKEVKIEAQKKSGQQNV